MTLAIIAIVCAAGFLALLVIACVALSAIADGRLPGLVNSVLERREHKQVARCRSTVRLQQSARNPTADNEWFVDAPARGIQPRASGR